MHLVTWQNGAGAWLDAPEGFDTEKEAREYAALYPARAGARVVIYSCNPVAEQPPPRPDRKQP